MPTWIVAGLWGLLAGTALLIGAGAGYLAPIPRKIVAMIMAFGGGVLISALAFELMDEAFREGGFLATAIGFLAGATVYEGANWVLARRGAKHRKRSGDQQKGGNGMAIALGSLLDGIPESIVIGVSMIAGGAVSLVTVIAIFISNIPEGLSSSVGMKRAGRKAVYVFGLWTTIAVVSGLAAVAGDAVFSHFSPGVIAATTAVAAGAILVMLSDTMIPEAFETTHNLTGLVTVLGFLVSFALSKIA